MRVNTNALSSADFISGFGSSPFSIYCIIKAGTIIDTSEGTISSLITPAVVMAPEIHSIMVVTSPMGENAPPELAAIITSDA